VVGAKEVWLPRRAVVRLPELHRMKSTSLERHRPQRHIVGKLQSLR